MTKKLPLLLFAVAACADQRVNIGGNYRTAAFVPPIENPDIDLLFVVDSSGSMIDNQAALAAHAKAALFDVIDAAVGGMPNLHVGVITPDLDLGVNSGDPACSDGGDAGRLHIGDFCPGITGNFLVDEDDGAGGRNTNYTGTLDEAFGCISQVGGNGCGFEEPLAAAALAVNETYTPQNAGFLRHSAMLVVIILTDEDDCSGASSDLFDPNNTALGPLDSYRCFHEGIQCTEDLDSVGPKTNCEASDNPLMRPLDDVLNDLEAAKSYDPSKLMVAVIAGTDDPTEVIMAGSPDPRLQLGASCVDNTDPGNPGTAFPAIRLDAFLDLFPGRSWRESICDPIDAALVHTANTIGDIAARRPCLRGTFKDVDPDTAGVQPSCRAFLATAAYTPTEHRRELTECRGHDGNCFQIVPDTASCSQWPDSLAVQLIGVTQGADEDLIVECIVPDP